MKAQTFTDEEVKTLAKNKYTAFVSSLTIRFTLEFKEMFMLRRQEGVSARYIFKEAGYDPDVLGINRIQNFAKRVPKEASSPWGLHEGYHTRKKYPSDTDYEKMPPKEAMAGMQHEIQYLRQELEFIKKIIKADSMGGQKQ